MAQSVTKVLDKIECNVTTMRGIQYNETFVDFLVVLISISTLAVRWITLNLAGPTIRFLQKVRNHSENSYGLLGINTSNFYELNSKWRCAYDYMGPTICAKDQTKIAEIIEVDRHCAQFVGCVQMQQTSVPQVMTIEELQQKLVNLKKATYITVFAISAVIPGIPLLVIGVLPSDQKETSTSVFQENNLVIKHLNSAGVKLIGLYFDGASHDRNWLGKTYCNNSELQSELGLTEESESILAKKFPLNLYLLEDKSPLLSGTDFYHCIKKGRNMHNSGTRIVPIGNYVMSTEHFWQLYIMYDGNSGLTTDVLNPKDKQSDELAERFYSSRVLKGILDLWLYKVFYFSTFTQRNTRKYGISWQTKDDFLYLGCTLILLINYFPLTYEDIPLCPWLISTAILEHIFGYARRLIEDFTLLDFLMMNEKIIKNIEIEMKGSIKRPDSNDGYNIRLGSIKESLDPRLVLFPTEFEIGNMMEKISTAMHGILKTIGIDFSSHEYIQIIREYFNSIHFENEHSNEEGAETGLIHDDAESAVEDLLLLHQQRRACYSFFELINHWIRLKPLDPIKIMKEMAQHRENFDEYTLKETRKFNPTLLQTSQNFVINTSDGSLNLEAALRIERMNAAEKSTSRTKGRLTRWTTACRKIFSITRLNPEDAQYAAGNFYFYVYNGKRIYVAEILAVFKKRGASYLRADSLDGLNANRIHAILYKQDISDPHKFQRILDPSRIQYALEEYSFCFINPLGNVELRSQTTSNFLGKYVILTAIQLQLYQKSVEEITNIELGILEVEALMKTKKK
ncbi:hypothetical protein GLOIN_2v1811542 [Rhizophagus clarus]|uniref:Uncharacterized protein n=1 Tax=Rhizophagus clarus TaxID=94130 RepID=A0A8H3MHZ9_9GLOM|nr:hypothetical protein GLOIN_2v1811542 [Rhizophagus clarus]